MSSEIIGILDAGSQYGKLIGKKNYIFNRNRKNYFLSFQKKKKKKKKLKN